MQHESDGAFAPGTRIATLSPQGLMGEVAIEALQPGDTVLTLLGPEEKASPIKAIRRIAGDAHPVPVRIAAGALAPAMPAADLLLPPTGLLRLRESLPSDVPVGPGEDPGALVPAAALLNSASITRDAAAQPECWWVLDLGEHSVVLANGAPVASGLVWPRCLEILPAGAALNRHRQRIAGRAEPPAEPATPLPLEEEPALTVIAAGAAVLLENEEGGLVATLPARSGPVRLRSPLRKAADDTDGRRFGVCVRGVSLDGVALDLASPHFGPGFHPIEGEGEHQWRWTNGEAWLVLPYSVPPRRLRLELTDWHTALALA